MQSEISLKNSHYNQVLSMNKMWVLGFRVKFASLIKPKEPTSVWIDIQYV